MLVRLIYASRATDSGAPALDAILAEARSHNPGYGITGILCYGAGTFLQAIEGARETVSELYALIQRDPRHQRVVLIHYEEIDERRFGCWTMGQVHLTKVHQAVLLRYSETAELDPYAVSGKVSLALLEELMATAAIVGRG